MAGKIRTLIESEEYAVAVKKLGGAHRLDSALNALTWAIATCAGDFEEVPGMSGIRLAKTDPMKDAPRLLLWFSIVDEDEALLRYIEPSKESSK
jgi:hypothetical protein